MGPPKGLITLFNHTSFTSLKNSRIASSVCGLVGLFGIPPLPAPLALLLLLRMRELVLAEDEEVVEREDEGLNVVPGKELV